MVAGWLAFVTQCYIKIANNHLCQFSIAVYPLVIINDSFGVRSIYIELFWFNSFIIDRVDRITFDADERMNKSDEECAQPQYHYIIMNMSAKERLYSIVFNCFAYVI